MILTNDTLSQLTALVGQPEPGDNLVRVVGAADYSILRRALRLNQQGPALESHCTTLSVYGNAANATASYELGSGLWDLYLDGSISADYTDLSGANDQDIILIAPGTEQNQIIVRPPVNGLTHHFTWHQRCLLLGGTWIIRARAFAGGAQHARVLTSIVAERIL